MRSSGSTGITSRTGCPASTSARARSNRGAGLRFYYAAAISRVRPHQPVLLPEQADDGSFRNANGRVKEDDPLIATAFAIHVLTRAKLTDDLDPARSLRLPVAGVRTRPRRGLHRASRHPNHAAASRDPRDPRADLRMI